MVEYNKLLYEIAVRFAANYLCQAKRAQTAHIKERSQMLECYEFIALHKPSEQLSSVSGWSQQAFTLWFVWIRVQQQPVLKVSKYIQHFITSKPRRACEIVHLQQFTREYRRGGGRWDWVTIDTFPHCRMFLWYFYWFTDYCGAGDEDEGEPVLESFSEDFQQPLTHSRICSPTHSLARLR